MGGGASAADRRSAGSLRVLVSILVFHLGGEQGHWSPVRRSAGPPNTPWRHRGCRPGTLSMVCISPSRRAGWPVALDNVKVPPRSSRTCLTVAMALWPPQSMKVRPDMSRRTINQPGRRRQLSTERTDCHDERARTSSSTRLAAVVHQDRRTPQHVLTRFSRPAHRCLAPARNSGTHTQPTIRTRVRTSHVEPQNELRANDERSRTSARQPTDVGDVGRRTGLDRWLVGGRRARQLWRLEDDDPSRGYGNRRRHRCSCDRIFGDTSCD